MNKVHDKNEIAHGLNGFIDKIPCLLLKSV
jgi:hypothetical protein